MMICFASNKDDPYALPKDRFRMDGELRCCVLTDEAFMSMQFFHKCGTKKCPFFKENRKDVRHD